jgi:tetratricopeptide (TPR) repeat protein
VIADHGCGLNGFALDYLSLKMSVDKEKIEKIAKQALTFRNNCDFGAFERESRLLIQMAPEVADGYKLLADSLIKQGRPREALEYINTAISLRGHNPDYHCMLGVAYGNLGEMQAARAAFLKAIELDRFYGYAYQGYAEITRFTEDDKVLAGARELLASSELQGKDRTQVEFALAKALDDLGQYDQAFAHFFNANQRNDGGYSEAEITAFVDRSIKVFDRQGKVLKRPPIKDSAVTPIFIVGMPRSGSTLLERVISMSPSVASGGEIRDIKNIVQQIRKYSTTPYLRYPEVMETAFDSALLLFRNSYLQRMRGFASDPEIVTHTLDKMLFNHLLVGLIFALFPNARVLHAIRDPIDTCLSCYFQNYHGKIDYASDLNDLRSYYFQYWRLMTHWHTVFGERILAVRYEDMVTDFDRQVARIVEFCDLPRGADYSRFHSNRSSVQTASVWQVRQPLYKNSLQRWRNYEKHLGPLADLRSLEWDPNLLREVMH